MRDRSASYVRPRTSTRHELERELRDLRERLADAEATLRAIGRNEVDALVVVRHEKASAQVLTIEGAHVPWCHFVDQMHEGALTVTCDGTILHTNRRMAQMAERDDLVGLSLNVLFDGPLAGHILSPADGNDPIVVRSALRRLDGSLSPVELSASPLPLTGVQRIAIVVTELADHEDARSSRLTRGAARSSIGDLETALKHVPVGIVLVDAYTGIVTYANRKAAHIIGPSLLSADRMITHVELTSFRRDGTVVEPEHLPVARVIRGEPVAREELVRMRADGTVVQTRCTAIPVHDSTGRVASVVLTIEDVTEEVTARTEREANDRFRELFIGMLGHDLRDPLSTIVMASRLLRDRLRGEDHGRLLQRLDSSAARMERLIDQILDFARARLGGGIPIFCVAMDLRALVEGAAADLRSTHPQRVIETSFDGSGSGEWDPDRLGQVVSNLLRNAIDHGDPAHPVRVSVRDDQGMVKLAINNRGRPIAPDLLPFIFDPFQSGAAGPGRSRQSIGLGLYIAKQIARAHGGALTVASSLEEGTTFTLTLPRLAPRRA